MLRDIDYAATAVKTSIVDKFGRQDDLSGLELIAGERLITVRDGKRTAEATRDSLLAGIRAANSYAELWEIWRAL